MQSIPESGAESRTPRPTDGSGSTGLDASGRINWWRLYRFPPVVSARPGPLVPESTTTTGTALPSRSGSIPASTSTPFSMPFSPSAPINTPMFGGNSSSPAYSSPYASTSSSSSTSSPTIPSSSDPTQNPSPNPTNNNHGTGNSVVPVIIVGLQSVNAPSWRPMMGMEGMEPDDLFGGGHHHHHHPNTHYHQHHRNPLTSDFGGDEDEGEEGDDFIGGGFGLPFTQTRDHRQQQQQQQQRERRGWQNPFRGLRSGNNGGGGGGGGDGGRRGQSTRVGFGGEFGASQEAGRQQQQQQQQALPPIGGPGSRTFLIYVIGGKFPHF